MKIANNKSLYIVEGTIEKLFLNQAKEKGLIQGGEVKTFNLMQELLKKQSSIFHKRYGFCYCVIDTDCAEKSNLDKLAANLQLITKMFASCRIELWIQHRNFEEELAYILGCKNIAALCKMLRIDNETTKGLKDIIAKQSNGYGQYLNDSNVGKYCLRYQEFMGIMKTSGINLPKSIYIRGVGEEKKKVGS